MRIASDTDFHFELPGIGRFRYGRRTFGDRIAIRAAFLRLSHGLGETGDPDLFVMSTVTAQHSVLCVSAPKGWEDLEKLDGSVDPDEQDAQVLALFQKVKELEDSFRKPRRADGAGQEGGAIAVQGDPVLVPAQVQPVAA